ncbi:ATP-binding protein [Nesterenkonia sp. CL21]|uniref:AlbA family DNA-binding domain-containing protein n=1 Tax=Nesterenkonia sp. CL21 TaxID=3064894 RepID=UPI002878B56E|nr:ATP-binding protein [Nesterenkonia sp. CL21]MDS2171343.1 ATP-binding protein [Nesterenkonia sp. CL21]
MTGKKAYQEDFAKFFEQPSREGLRDVLRTHHGELDQMDFKKMWPEWPKVACHVLALANSGGGCMVIGVAENEGGSADHIGVTEFVDKADVASGVAPFLPDTVEYVTLDFEYNDSEYAAIKGKKFQVLVVEDKPEELPFLAEKDGKGISAKAVYVRKGTSSRPATHADLQRLISRRIETGHSSNPAMDLDEHLDHLKVLYGAISRVHTRSAFASLTEMLNAGMYTRERNAAYPDETFDEFVAAVVEEKKAVIRQFLNVEVGGAR